MWIVMLLRLTVGDYDDRVKTDYSHLWVEPVCKGMSYRRYRRAGKKKRLQDRARRLAGLIEAKERRDAERAVVGVVVVVVEVVEEFDIGKHAFLDGRDLGVL